MMQERINRYKKSQDNFGFYPNYAWASTQNSEEARRSSQYEQDNKNRHLFDQMKQKINVLDNKVEQKDKIIQDMEIKMKNHQENIEQLSKYIDSTIKN